MSSTSQSWHTAPRKPHCLARALLAELGDRRAGIRRMAFYDKGNMNATQMLGIMK